MDGRLPGHKPLPEAMMAQFTDAYVSPSLSIPTLRFIPNKTFWMNTFITVFVIDTVCINKGVAFEQFVARNTDGLEPDCSNSSALATELL